MINEKGNRDGTVRRSASLSKCGNFRWTLTREWDSSLPKACYIGHNPSKADAAIEDPTTMAWAWFARVNGYGGYVAVNIYPFRSSDPKECRRWADFENNGPDWYARDVMMENIELVATVAKQSGIVVASWGAIARDEGMVDKIIEEIQSGDAPYPAIYCLGLTKDGAPKHPMARGRHRIHRDQRFAVWLDSAGNPQATGSAPEQKD